MSRRVAAVNDPSLGRGTSPGSSAASTEWTDETEDQVAEAVAALRRWRASRPVVGIILGTGLGDFASQLEQAIVIPCRELPHFPRATALSHSGQLVWGFLAGTEVVALAGRVHLYEGYAVEQVVFPVRVLAALGVTHLVVTNASGGLHPQLASGDIVVITDHLDLLGRRAVPVNATPVPRGAGPYDGQLVDVALATARRQRFPARAGTYVAVTGPNYETRAEYRFLRKMGGDVVGMSTIPEVLAAHRLGLRCLALSVVTNVARPDAASETTAEEVVSAAHRASTRLEHILRAAVAACRSAGREEPPAPA